MPDAYRTPHSHRFISTHAQNAWTRYTVPAGYRAVIMSVGSVCGQAMQSYVEIAVATAYLFFFDFPGVGTQVRTELRTVAYPGDLIEVNHSGGLLWTTVSGYLLRDDGAALEEPAQWPAPPPALPPLEHDPPAGS